MQLANALLQNCGIKMHRELASRSFTDAVLKLANDKACLTPRMKRNRRILWRLTSVKNTHQEVKAKILESLGSWSEKFSKDPDLGIMEQAFLKLKSQSTHFSRDPHLEQLRLQAD